MNLFEMFESAVPESLKKQEEELRKQEEAKKSKGKSNKGNKESNKPATPKKPSIPEVDIKQVHLPSIVYFGREKIVLECSPELAVPLTITKEQIKAAIKKAEKVEDLQETTKVKQESDEENEELNELENEDVEQEDEAEFDEENEENNDEDETDESEESDEGKTEEVPAGEIEVIDETTYPIGSFREDITLRIVVPADIIEKGLISKEDTRKLLQREFPQLTKERTIIEYDKKERMIVPVVKAASKGC